MFHPALASDCALRNLVVQDHPPQRRAKHRATRRDNAHMRRPQITLLAILATLAISVSACGAPASPAAEAAPAAAEVATAAPTAEETAADEAATAAPIVEPEPDANAAPTEALETAPAAAAIETRVFAIDPAGSKATYAVYEEFLGQNVAFVTAIGATQSITGSIELNIDGSSLAIGANEFVVDLSTLTSDRPRRDNAIRRDWLQSSTYPLATFKATEVTELPADAALGSEVAFKLAGDLTIRETTLPQTWDVRAILDGSTLVGTAQSFLYMRDFGFEPPDIAGMLKVTDGVTVTLDFTAVEQ